MIYYCTCDLSILLVYNDIGQSLVTVSRNLRSDDRRRDISNKLPAIDSLGHYRRHNILPHFIAMQWPFENGQKRNLWVVTSKCVSERFIGESI